MKVVRVDKGVVVEVIPDYALPVDTFYGETFASMCVKAPDEVGQDWAYNSDSNEFRPPTPQLAKPTQEEQMRSDIDFIAAMTGVQL